VSLRFDKLHIVSEDKERKPRPVIRRYLISGKRRRIVVTERQAQDSE